MSASASGVYLWREWHTLPVIAGEPTGGTVAQKVEVILVDDLDGSSADETIQFGLDGWHYEIDLSVEHAQELREQVKGYVRRGRAVAPPAPRLEAARIRAWAQENGYEVSTRGRIHRDIVEAYRNAKR